MKILIVTAICIIAIIIFSCMCGITLIKQLNVLKKYSKGRHKSLYKHIFIINGSGGVGKDTFVGLVSTQLNDMLKKFHTIINFSSVDKVKEIAREIGWDGKKPKKTESSYLI